MRASPACRRHRSKSRDKKKSRSRSRDRKRKARSGSRSKHRHRSRSRSKSRWASPRRPLKSALCVEGFYVDVFLLTVLPSLQGAEEEEREGAQKESEQVCKSACLPGQEHSHGRPGSLGQKVQQQLGGIVRLKLKLFYSFFSTRFIQRQRRASGSLS